MKKTVLILLALVIAASGCSSNTDTENGGGPIINHEKQITYGKTYTTVDVVIETQFSCSWASPPEETVLYETKLISQGEVVATEKWGRNYTDCMNSETTYKSFDVDSKYKQFLIITEAQNYDA